MVDFCIEKLVFFICISFKTRKNMLIMHLGTVGKMGGPPECCTYVGNPDSDKRA